MVPAYTVPGSWLCLDPCGSGGTLDPPLPPDFSQLPFQCSLGITDGWADPFVLSVFPRVPLVHSLAETLSLTGTIWGLSLRKNIVTVTLKLDNTAKSVRKPK